MKEKISAIGILVNFVLTVLKIAVGLLSRSSAVIAEGIHSGMDIVSSSISYFGIRVAKKPVDKEHPYGHYKSEVIAGFVITIILFITALWIVYEAVIGFASPKELFIGPLTLGIMAGSAIVNEVMARVKMKYGKNFESMALIADAQHSRVDVFVSLGVFIGLFFTGLWTHMDSLLALVIGGYVLFESLSLGKQTTDSLLDVTAGEVIENKIKEIAKSEGVKLSSLKTRKLGSYVSADMQVELSPKYTIEEASVITKKLEERLTGEIPNLRHVTISLKSHEIKEAYYRGALGRGFGWRGRMRSGALGPGGSCVCPKCGFIMPHKRGVPCARKKCPKCRTKMTRQR